VNSKILSTNTSSFVSTGEDKLPWGGYDEVNFFLENGTSLPYVQSSYLNNYTIYEPYTAQYIYCGNLISKDYWAYNQSFCENGYTYGYVLSSTSSSIQYCYVIAQNFTLDNIRGRYQDHQLFENCQKINGQKYYQAIINYWTWAQNSYNFDENLQGILKNINTDFENVNEYINFNISKLYKYYLALKTSQSFLVSLQDNLDAYYSVMNCSMVKDLTAQLYLGFCGEFLEYVFYIGIYSGALGISNMFFSLSIVLFIFRYRTDLEIEQEKILRSIGKSISIDYKEPEVTMRDETIIKN
jgi:hypothetical protein